MDKYKKDMKKLKNNDPNAYREMQEEALAERSRDIKYALAHYVNVKMLITAKTMELYGNMQVALSKISVGEEIYKIHSSQPNVAKDIRHYGLVCSGDVSKMKSGD